MHSTKPLLVTVFTLDYLTQICQYAQINLINSFIEISSKSIKEIFVIYILKTFCHGMAWKALRFRITVSYGLRVSSLCFSIKH